MKSNFGTACITGLAFWLAACGLSPWPDDEGSFESSISYGQIGFSIYPRRFVNVGDSVSIQITGMQTAYTCTQITEISLELNDSASGRNSAAYQAFIRGQFPTIPDCSREKGRNTEVWFDFSGLKPGVSIQFVEYPPDTNKGEDSSEFTYAVTGKVQRDTLLHLKNELNITTKGPFLYRDTSGLAAAKLFADTLPPCTFLNWAQARKHLDTTWVVFESIELDSGVAAWKWTCPSGPHSDSLPIQWLEAGN